MIRIPHTAHRRIFRRILPDLPGSRCAAKRNAVTQRGFGRAVFSSVPVKPSMAVLSIPAQFSLTLGDPLTNPPDERIQKTHRTVNPGESAVLNQTVVQETNGRSDGCTVPDAAVYFCRIAPAANQGGRALRSSSCGTPGENPVGRWAESSSAGRFPPWHIDSAAAHKGNADQYLSIPLLLSHFFSAYISLMLSSRLSRQYASSGVPVSR